MMHTIRAGWSAGLLLMTACAAGGAPPDESTAAPEAELAQRLAAPDPCAVVRCMAPLTCQVEDGRAVCVPPPTCDPGASCKSDADCRLTADYCGGCNCLALGPGESLPKCTQGEVACLVDPCRDLAARCEQGSCVVGDATR